MSSGWRSTLVRCAPRSRPAIPGIRVFYIDRNWQLKSRLLAVRQFNPSSQLLEDDRLSALLLSYLGEVLEEFGLSVEHLFSATTSSGCGFKRLCEVLLPGLWEWCMCSLVNDALSEVRFGACCCLGGL